MCKLAGDWLKISWLILTMIVCAPFVLAQNEEDGKQKNNINDDKAAGDTTRLPEFLNRRNELILIGGVAPNMPPRKFFDSGRHSTFGFVGLRYTRRLGAKKYLLLKYTIDVIPAAFIKYDQIRRVETAPGVFATERNTEAVYAAAVMPAGIQLNFRRPKKVQPFISSNVGMIFFTESVPDDSSTLAPNQRGKPKNIIFGLDGGVEFPTESGKGFIVGFKFQHISNFSTGKINPGFNQNLIYFGYTFKKW